MGATELDVCSAAWSPAPLATAATAPPAAHVARGVTHRWSVFTALSYYFSEDS